MIIILEKREAIGCPGNGTVEPGQRLMPRRAGDGKFPLAAGFVCGIRILEGRLYLAFGKKQE
jgi:hypothetical protein